MSHRSPRPTPLTRLCCVTCLALSTFACEGGDGDPASDGDGGNAPAQGGAIGTDASSTSGGMTSVGSPVVGGSVGTSTVGGATGQPTTDCGQDECPLSSGLTYACKQRFALGINYAWHNFAGDFGGISAWNQGSISQSPATYSSEIQSMADNGVSVIRWWMFPDFRGDGVQFDDAGNPTGISETTVADIAKALEIAETSDVYLVLTIFSFDNFRPDRVDSGLTIRSLSPMVTDATRRSAVVNNIVRPIAKAAAASPNAKRLLGWDVINEPEWAIAATGTAANGQDFDPNPELSAVAVADMKALIAESIAALREETPTALTSVGWAAAKWSWAFADINVDFHQPHIYAWVNKYWPYTLTPDKLGYSAGKPVVMGEYYLLQMPFETSDTFDQIATSWWDNGYAGAWSWQFIENQSNLNLIKAFADKKGCQAGF